HRRARASNSAGRASLTITAGWAIRICARGMELGGVLAARARLDGAIEALFALPGGHNLPLFEGARQVGLRLVDTRHEENAVFMAEGWALATGHPAAASVTAGPR